jgi:hypothetical protein
VKCSRQRTGGATQPEIVQLQQALVVWQAVAVGLEAERDEARRERDELKVRLQTLVHCMEGTTLDLYLPDGTCISKTFAQWLEAGGGRIVVGEQPKEVPHG